ncbi:hypothetical protein GQX74_014096 [Glossina fuscipes]|nr:hypothetical protein GQX74_014096 [Glossina fuscipes]
MMIICSMKASTVNNLNNVGILLYQKKYFWSINNITTSYKGKCKHSCSRVNAFRKYILRTTPNLHSLHIQQSKNKSLLSFPIEMHL